MKDKDSERRPRLGSPDAQGHWLLQLVDLMEEVTWATDGSGQEVFFVNRAFEKVYGRSLDAFREAPDTWLAAVVEEDRHLAEKSAADLFAHGQSHVEYRIRRPDGSVRWLSDSKYLKRLPDGTPQFMGGIGKDITEYRDAVLAREASERERTKTMRLTSLGRLAGGVAHDLNNMLQAILGQANLGLDSGAEDWEVRESLRNIEEAARRGAHVISRLLAFSRAQPMQRSILEANEAADTAFSLVRPLLPADIEVERDFADEPLPIEADTAFLDQIIVNLCVNARDAMPDGGRLAIRTRKVQRRKPAAADGQPAGATDYVRVEVSDTGIGIDEESLDRIFEPFFTTKASTGGTGLGLAAVHGLVVQHGGTIEVQSQVGQGTTFTIHLPLRRAPRASPVDNNVEATPRPVEENPLVLVAEDDPLVRRTTVRVLRRAGYRVEETTDGAEAVQRFAELGAAIDLVVLDVVMPVMSGPAAWKEMLELGARVPVVFCSGYSPEEVQGQLGELTSFELMTKPYDSERLLEKLRQALG